ncbi:hypothetical protein BC628DRAFT_87302 [Trametes gibbosa]|nr:hypothetical protein BC628DRAFT_87302 [Trametes gibbosa]
MMAMAMAMAMAILLGDRGLDMLSTVQRASRPRTDDSRRTGQQRQGQTQPARQTGRQADRQTDVYVRSRTVGVRGSGGRYRLSAAAAGEGGRGSRRSLSSA